MYLVLQSQFTGGAALQAVVSLTDLRKGFVRWQWVLHKCD
jgi:hypothetical protein